MKRKLLFLTTIILSFVCVLSGCRVEITATYDAVIFGSGVSSLTAALNLNEQGKRVLIVEESGIVGGNKRLISDGISYLNTDGNDTEEQFIEDITENNGSTNFFTETLVKRSKEIPTWLQKYNIQLDKTIKLPGHNVARTLVSTKGVHTGKEVVTKLESAIKENKIEVNYNSKITKIITEKKNMYQVTIEQPSSVINVNAKTVVFGEDDSVAYDAIMPITNKSQLEEKNFSAQIPMSTGMELLNTLNADYSKTGNLNIIDTYNTSSAQKISPILRSYGAMLINKSGERFVNEMSDTPTIIESILAQEDQVAYLVYDDVIDSQLSFLNEYYKDSTVLTTNSVNTLATSLKMTDETLRSTITKYHHMIMNKEDTDFNRSFDVDSKTFEGITTGQGTYFVSKITPVTTAFSSYAEITDKFEVMRKGIALPGIYAIGDSAKDVRLNDMLHGTELTFNIVMGTVASEFLLEYLNTNEL